MDASLNRDLYDQIVRGIAESRRSTERMCDGSSTTARFCQRPPIAGTDR